MCEILLFVLFFNTKGVKIHSTKFSASMENGQGHLNQRAKISFLKFRFANLGCKLHSDLLFLFFKIRFGR